jgi:hypothetical protein
MSTLRKSAACVPRIGSATVLVALALVIVTLCASTAVAQPDPRQMSGMPLPVGDVPVGTVTVRVIRGSFANPVSSQTVELTGAGSPIRATTSEEGRAEFNGLKPGTRVQAQAVVGGERLVSQEFEVPASGGIRLILAAADPSGAAPPAASAADPGPTAPATAGEVVLGEESRFVFEMGENGLSVFYILQIVNPSSAPVEPRTPLVFELPEEAKGATILQGSSPQATVAGNRMEVKGPFAPGPTLVQLAYSMPFSGPEIEIDQKLPAPLAHLAVVAQKVGDVQLESANIAEQRTMPAQGNLYIAGRGGPVQAGDTLHFRFTGMPHYPTWPRNVALSLAGLILALGIWAASRTRGARQEQIEQRRQVELSRDSLFEELSALEARFNEDGVDPEDYAAKRRELIASLERVYAALDDEAPLERAS